MGFFDIFKKRSVKADEKDSTKDETILGVPEMLIFKLLFINEPVIEYKKILEEVKTHVPNAICSNENSPFIFTFPDIQIELADAIIHYQCTIIKNDKVELPEAAFQQNWHWAEANEEANICVHEILVTDLWGSPIPYKGRLALFMNFLVSVVKVAKPQVIYSVSGEKLIKPIDLINNWTGKERQTLYSICNVRLFNITDSAKNEHLLDTIGLQKIGLPDFQIRFSDYEVNSIARLLWNYAYYLYEHNDIIEDGNTLEGIVSDTKWKCTRQISSVSPERIVIEVEPD